MTRKAYVVGAYSALSREKKSENANKAREAGIKLIKDGYLPFVPHLNFFCFEEELKEKKIMKCCEEWLKECDVVYAIKGWSASIGSCKEIELAEKLNKEIIYEE